MIGGNAYFGQRPSHELMVRWTQVNALMPAMQFSIAPWDLSPETARLCAAALQLRKQVRSSPFSFPSTSKAPPLSLLHPLCTMCHWVIFCVVMPKTRLQCMLAKVPLVRCVATSCSIAN